MPEVIIERCANCSQDGHTHENCPGCNCTPGQWDGNTLVGDRFGWHGDPSPVEPTRYLPSGQTVGAYEVEMGRPWTGATLIEHAYDPSTSATASRRLDGTPYCYCGNGPENPLHGGPPPRQPARRSYGCDCEDCLAAEEESALFPVLEPEVAPANTDEWLGMTPRSAARRNEPLYVRSSGFVTALSDNPSLRVPLMPIAEAAIPATARIIVSDSELAQGDPVQLGAMVTERLSRMIGDVLMERIMQSAPVIVEAPALTDRPATFGTEYTMTVNVRSITGA